MAEGGQKTVSYAVYVMGFGGKGLEKGNSGKYSWNSDIYL
jgi:hypothetical protein